MYKKKIFVVIVIVLMIVFAAWSPWVDLNFAQENSRGASDKITSNRLLDGLEPCSFIKIKSFEKALWGARVTSEYQCQTRYVLATEFVSFIGSIHNRVWINP